MIKPMDIEKILTEGIVFKGSKLNGKKKEEKAKLTKQAAEDDFGLDGNY